jgi:phenylpropionate dioxygenase-like ring-hydroxylating dioxygenase large terminal subunit
MPAPFLRNAWYAIGWSEHLAAGELLARTVLNEELVFFREPAGAVCALADCCPHRFAPLSRGKLLPNGRLQCGYHGLELDGSGACVYNPHGNHNIPPAARVTSYPVIDRHGLLWIWMGERTPDPAAIPDFSPFGSDAVPLAIGVRDYLHLKCSYKLILDNILDSSHVNFVHPGILGNEAMISGRTAYTQDGNSVTVSRDSENVPVPGMYQALFPGEDVCDKWVDTTWHPASAIILKGGVGKPGAPRDEGTGIYGAHLATPETDRTTHYFFSSARWNMLTTGEAENTRIRDRLSEVRRFAFEHQDGPLIEAQQRSMDKLAAKGEVRPTLLAVDVGQVRFERILDALMAEEAQQLVEVLP